MQLGIAGLPRLAGFALDAAPSTFDYIHGGIPDAMEWTTISVTIVTTVGPSMGPFGERAFQNGRRSSPPPSLNSFVACYD